MENRVKRLNESLSVGMGLGSPLPLGESIGSTSSQSACGDGIGDRRVGRPRFRKIPLATMQPRNVGDRRPSQPRSLRGVVINTLYILSNTNALSGGHLAVCRHKNRR
ncbi:MAG: hypothetical protein QOG67_1129 [Verrucomicrobiota bacterium]|jgi:hypothetical protein